MDGLDLVVEERDPHRGLGALRGEDVEHVAAHAKHPAPELDVVPLVLHVGEPLDGVALGDFLLLAQVQDHRVIVDRIADAVDRGDSAHDDRVAALEQRLGGGEPHLLDVLVDARVLLDVEVLRGDVGLRLVVIVVRDEVLDGVVGKELAHLGIELRGERLVGREDERGAAQPRDDVGHRVGLARAGHPEERLVREPVAHARGELLYGFRLVARRLERLVEPVRTFRKDQRRRPGVIDFSDCGLGGWVAHRRGRG